MSAQVSSLDACSSQVSRFESERTMVSDAHRFHLENQSISRIHAAALWPNTIVICFYGEFVQNLTGWHEQLIIIINGKNRVRSDRNFNACEKNRTSRQINAEVKWKEWDVFRVSRRMILSMGKIYGSINILPRWFIYSHSRSGEYIVRCACTFRMGIFYWGEKKIENNLAFKQCCAVLFIAETLWPQNVR